MQPRRWRRLTSEIREDFRIFSLRVDRAVSPRTGIAHDFYVLESMDWVNVIPVTQQEEVVLIRQYRHGTRDVTLEIPGGLVEGNDSPEGAARRELLEETGYQERAMVPLGFVHPNPAFLDNRCYTFLARDVYAAAPQSQDEKEDIEVVLRPLSEIPRLIREGEITHSLVVAAFYRFFVEYLPG
jgi:ADP-ribose pyrophosphatase